jgi:DNA modification methylase
VSKLIHGSCLEENSGLPALRDNSVDHFILDPPYEEYTHSNRMGLRKEGGKGVAEPVDVQMGFEFIPDEERIAVAREMVRVGKGWVIVFCEDYAIRSWVEACGCQA